MAINPNYMNYGTISATPAMMPNYINNPAIYQQPIMSSMTQAPTTNSNIQWVQGIEGAKSFQQGPNTITPLWDSDSQTIYLKSTDATGRPSIEPIDYVYRNKQQSNSQAVEPVIDSHISKESTVEYATKDDIDNLNRQLSSITTMLKSDNKQNKKGGN